MAMGAGRLPPEAGARSFVALATISRRCYPRRPQRNDQMRVEFETMLLTATAHAAADALYFIDF